MEIILENEEQPQLAVQTMARTIINGIWPILILIRLQLKMLNNKRTHHAYSYTTASTCVLLTILYGSITRVCVEGGDD